MSFSKLFGDFKREKTPLGVKSVAEEIYFQLLSDEFGYYLEVVDAKARATQVSHTAYTGAMRDVLRQIEGIKNRSAFVIDWEKPSGRVYLPEHPYLLAQLSHCHNVIGDKKQQFTFVEEQATVRLSITNLPENIDGTIMCQAQLLAWRDDVGISNFTFITEEYILAQPAIIRIQNVGSNYHRLPLLNATFEQAELAQYLSLLYTYFDNIEVLYDDYEISPSSDVVSTEPCLIFERMDTNESLYMRVGQMLENFSFDFLEQFDLQYVASINDLDRKITVRPLELRPLDSMLDEIGAFLRRHIKKERRRMDDVVQSDALFIIERDVAAAFIYTDLPSLLHKYKVYGAEKLKNYKIATIQPSLQLKLNHGIDFLEGDAFLDFEGEMISLFDAITQYNNQSYILLSDGRQAIVNESYMKKLQRLFKKKKDKVQISFFDLPLVEDLIDEKVNKASFSKTRAIFDGFNKINEHTTELPAIQADLRSYQKYGFKWLMYLHQIKLGGCLADDMGLGKTLQALTLLADIYPNKATLPSLVVMPRTLIFNWENEVQKFAPWLKTYTYYAATRNWDDANQAQIIFTTYGMVRNEIEQFREKEFYYVILDESQNIKNLTSQATKAVMLLQSQHRLALSGTPIENNLGELYSLFRFLNPPMFGSVEAFNQQYATPIQKNNDPNVIKELRKKIYPFILRRLKKDVLTELPDKIEQVLYIEMSERQRKFYEQRRNYYQTVIRGQIAEKGLQEMRFYIFQALSELRQIASIPEAKTKGKIASPKIEVLIEQLFDAIANGHKALIFVNFLAAVELIGEQLQKAGVDFVSMTGATHDRQSLVNKFQNDKNCKVFLMTLKTGGTGLNLTAADMVFIFDPWWNQAAESQAIDRTHRMGQTQKVSSYKMITRGTIEEKILQLQLVKKELFDSVISSDSGSLKALSEDDIQFILS